MKIFNLLFAVTFLLFGCSENNTEKNDKQIILNETPESLNKENSLLSDFSSRNYRSNIIENLYSEALDNNAELEQLNNKIIEIKSDSLKEKTESYLRYKNLNKSYWDNVKNYTERLKDSVLKIQVNEIFEQLEKDHDKRVSVHENKLEQINSLKYKLADQQILLKLFITQPMMSNYQINELPDVKHLESLIENIEDVIENSKEYTKINK